MWENVVSACRQCNHRKGGKSIAEAHMNLRVQPHEPRAGVYYTIERRLDITFRDDWHKFLPALESPRSWSASQPSSESSSIPA